MGQRLTVAAGVIDATAVFTTDRTVTGQDGHGFDPAAAASGNGVPDRLAQQLFAGVPGIDRVWIASNVVVATRRAGWDDATLAEASRVVETFFVHYGH